MPENKPKKRSLWAKWPLCGRTWAIPGRSLVSLEGNKRPPLDSELGNASEISARWKSWWGGCLQGLELTDDQQLKRPQVLNDALVRKSPRSPVTRTQGPGSPSGQRLQWIVWRMEGVTYPSNYACPQKVNPSQHLPLCPWKCGQSKFLQLYSTAVGTMFGEKMWMRTSSGRAGKRPCWQNWTGKQCGEGVPGEDSGMILKGYLAPGAKGQWWVLHVVETESLCWQRICIPFTSRVTLAMTPRLSEHLFLHPLSQASHVRRAELSEGER